MKSFRLTVFTEPIKAEGVLADIKSLLRPLRFVLQGRKFQGVKKYGGHYAVTRSLIEGLTKMRTMYNYNPWNKKEINENVIVLAGVERLKDMIALKREGKIGMLLTGPNVVEDVRAEDAIVADPAIDHYIVPSDWVKDLAVNDCPVLRDRVRTWAAGIDTDIWRPQLQSKKVTDVLIYWKSEPGTFYNDIVQLVEEQGLTHTTIRYGAYTVDEYREKLANCRFTIFITRSESQGIAMFESWAMDVPTFVFDPGEFLFHGRTITNVSSCPYLVRSAGLKWKNPDQLKSLLATENSFTGYSPREYVLANFTDEISARRLVSFFKN